MKPPPILIKGINQKNNNTFTIEWTDGVVSDYTLDLLQRNCPCARCHEEASKKQNGDKGRLSVDLRALRIYSVGRYALRVQFTTGCSSGIFSYEQLRELSKQPNLK